MTAACTPRCASVSCRSATTSGSRPTVESWSTRWTGSAVRRGTHSAHRVRRRRAAFACSSAPRAGTWRRIRFTATGLFKLPKAQRAMAIRNRRALMAVPGACVPSGVVPTRWTLPGDRLRTAASAALSSHPTARPSDRRCACRASDPHPFRQPGRHHGDRRSIGRRRPVHPLADEIPDQGSLGDLNGLGEPRSGIRGACRRAPLRGPVLPLLAGVCELDQVRHPAEGLRTRSGSR